MNEEDIFYEGAGVAYTDCADLLERIANNIPGDMTYNKYDLLRLSNSFRTKISAIQLMQTPGKGNA